MNRFDDIKHKGSNYNSFFYMVLNSKNRLFISGNLLGRIVVLFVCFSVPRSLGKHQLVCVCVCVLPNPCAQPEILHTLDPSFLSFPALSAGAYTTTLVVMEAVVS